MIGALAVVLIEELRENNNRITNEKVGNMLGK